MNAVTGTRLRRGHLDPAGASFHNGRMPVAGRPTILRPTILLYGNCQAWAFSAALRRLDAVSGRFSVAYVCSFDMEQHNPARQLAKIDMDAVVLLIEQLDAKAPTPAWLTEGLRPGVPRLRLVPMDIHLLWPFQTTDPRNHPEPGHEYGRHPYGDRLVLELLGRGLGPRTTYFAYRVESPGRLPNIERMAELDTVRRRKREAEAQVTFSDIIAAELRRRPLFWTYDHPTGWLFQQVTARLLDVMRPLLRLDYTPATVLRQLADFEPLANTQMPVHPDIARRLGLAWFSPDQRYQTRIGLTQSYQEWLRGYIAFV